MVTCEICGFEFDVNKENRYTAENEITCGVAEIIVSKEATLFDACDCPNCGCQHILQPRKRRHVESEKGGE